MKKLTLATAFSVLTVGAIMLGIHEPKALLTIIIGLAVTFSGIRIIFFMLEGE